MPFMDLVGWIVAATVLVGLVCWGIAVRRTLRRPPSVAHIESKRSRT